MAEVLFHMSTEAQGRVLRPEELHRMLLREMDEFGKDAEVIYASHALHRTGRMARNVKSARTGQDVMVTVEARDPQTGFDYVRITRFGHRVDKIVPKRFLATEHEAVVLATGRTRGQGRHAALRFVIGGAVLYRRSTKGFHPASDWADKATPQIRARAVQRMGALGRRIEARWVS